MIEKIGNYTKQIMQREETNSLLYPIVVPIVIYTGFQKWTAKTKFSQKQYYEKVYSEYQYTSLWYNLIAVQDYTFEELLETTSLFTSFMIMEKCKTKEEKLVYTKKIINKLKKEKSKELAEEIIKNIMALFFGRNIITKMLEELERKEEISMSPATKMLFDLQLEGEKRGIMKTIKETAQKMLKKNMDLKDIEEITGLTKEEIEKLQECV